MKGIVFVQFLEMVDEKFSMEVSERLIENSDLPSKGIYTTVGTYDVAEMVSLVTNLSKITAIPVPELLREFGRYMFGGFVKHFPAFFEGVNSTFEFLPRVDSYVHLEVRKLYSDAELPEFTCDFPDPDTFHMTYRSSRHLQDLAEGLILGCIEHFGEHLAVSRKTPEGDPQATLFIVSRQRTSHE